MFGLLASVMFPGDMLASHCVVCGNVGNAVDARPNSLTVGFTRRSCGNSAGIAGKMREHGGDRQSKANNLECMLC